MGPRLSHGTMQLTWDIFDGVWLEKIRVLKLWTGEAMRRSKSFVDALVWRLMTWGAPKVPGTALVSTL